MELTFANLKPDCVERNLTGKVIDFIESKGFEIIKMQKMRLSKIQAEEFYKDHVGALREITFFFSFVDVIH